MQARLNDSLRQTQQTAGDADAHLRVLFHLKPDLRADVVRSRDDYEAGVRDLIELSRTERPIATTPTHLLAKLVLGIVNWPYQWYRPDGLLSSAEIAPALTDRALAALRA
jgi:hypothetical protein